MAGAAMFVEGEAMSESDGRCEGCGLAVFGEGRCTDDDIFLCGPCFDEVPKVYPCVGGCGYPVSQPNDLCGECACEDDGAIW